MLDELKNLNYQGGKDGLLFFLSDVIGNGQIKISDAVVLCSHAPGKRYLVVESLISYCAAFGWIKISENMVALQPEIVEFIVDKDKLNRSLVESTVRQLFDSGIIESDMFCYEAIQNCYFFKNEMLPLSLSVIRNMLISQGFFVPYREEQSTRFYISATYESLVAKYSVKRRRQLSLEQLKKRLERNNLAGEKAELFVMEYERKRLGEPLSNQVKRISEIDVTAGYDIVSFESERSTTPDRFIEVKAISDSGFYWSKNEYAIARLKSDTYFLYLVDLSKVAHQGYIPQIIRNPAKIIMESENWLVEAQTYLIRQI